MRREMAWQRELVRREGPEIHQYWSYARFPLAEAPKTDDHYRRGEPNPYVRCCRLLKMPRGWEGHLGTCLSYTDGPPKAKLPVIELRAISDTQADRSG